MDQIHLFTGSRQINGILQRHISTADHSYRSAPEKSSVAGSAVGHTHDVSFFLTGHTKLRMLRTGGKNHRTGLQFPVSCVDAFVIATFFHTVYRGF